MQYLKQTSNAEIKLLFKSRQLGVVIPADFAVNADYAGIRCFLMKVQQALLTLYLRLCYG
ncbi:hypothetical protein LDL79_03675 [Leeuwenhoekiella palythoae]|uniref:hypothetical protein n=1 Tax=Leeuwenhoekiella palythoae TaxID=573501 RepID=UPI001CE1678F|nr:hypothetical protein [Leeuwenhoekiella palythoae]UBZ11220.1 hypothetical protein LDL79_03675 [Leeuwenhoekiella palythoae]